MLRLSTPNYQRFSQAKQFDTSYSGGEANVAVSLANYGMESCFVTRLPQNEIADAAIASLRSHNVDTSQIVRGGDRIGIYFLETGSVNRSGKVLYDRINSSIATIGKDDIDWDKVFEGAAWFHWTGITPAISQQAADRCLEALQIAQSKGITISCDLNYRKNLWKYGKKASEIMPRLVEFCDVILGNEEDAEKVFGIHASNADIETEKVHAASYENVCKQLTERFPKAKKVIITLRGSINANHNTWSGILYNGKTFFTAPTYDITHIVDRVGAGDSFMGGLIYGLLHYKEDQKALDFATAASCLKHTIHGDFNLVSAAEVEHLMNGNISGRVSR